jgi:hypothetical protein
MTVVWQQRRNIVSAWAKVFLWMREKVLPLFNLLFISYDDERITVVIAIMGF